MIKVTVVIEKITDICEKFLYKLVLTGYNAEKNIFVSQQFRSQKVVV